MSDGNNRSTDYTDHASLFSRIQFMGDCHRFHDKRAAYYRYLADLLEGLRGSRSLRDIFLLDALRYGIRSWRGRLYHRWAALYETSGGDLYSTWSSAIPHDELSTLRSAQLQGNVALIRSLGELAEALTLTRHMQRMLASNLWTAGIAIMLLMLVLFALPVFTVPQLLQAFSAVTPDLYGASTRSLIAFSDQVLVWGPVIAVASVILLCWARWSLPNYCGPGRAVLDRVFIWRIHRYMSSVRLLRMLVIVLGDQVHGSIQLRSALLVLRDGSCAWLVRQIDSLIHQFDQGVAVTAAFNTGLFDREHCWFLSDMISARGLGNALALTSLKLRDHMQSQITRNVLITRWLALFMCLGALMCITLWHYAVIDELRRAMINFYAGH
jgi:type II secretory pathway component PulF